MSNKEVERVESKEGGERERETEWIEREIER
jgi:hypothetical protein